MSEETNQSQPTSIADLAPKMKLEGVIRRVELYGAFVDLGLERDGLIHISQLSDRHVDRVSDVVSEGDRVTVWVTRVDPEQGRIALTMVKPPDVTWKELKVGQVYTGKVVRIERYGVFVDIGAERPGLLHSREMGGRVFGSPAELFHMGDEIDVRILSLDRSKKRIDLTMEEFAEATIEEDEDEEELPTPFEMAFRKARHAEVRRHGKHSGARGDKQRSEQDDILSRTLQQHG